MKTINYPVMIEKQISIRNVVHLNQTQGNPLIIKSLKTKFGYDGFTSFTNNLLTGTANLSSLQIIPNIREYLKTMKKDKEKVKEDTPSTIPYDYYKR